MFKLGYTLKVGFFCPDYEIKNLFLVYMDATICTRAIAKAYFIAMLF